MWKEDIYVKYGGWRNLLEGEGGRNELIWLRI